jgi:rubrerythrin
MAAPETLRSIEQAIVKALEYERRVREVYRQAVADARDPVGKKVFGVLADEEQGHIDYLEHKLERLRAAGEIVPGGIATALPTRQAIEAGVATLERRLAGADFEPEAALLRRALVVEEETSAFYKRMVDELPREGRDFFFPFMTIEEGHVAIVQAELDAVTQMGFWFDYQEFDLETA